jgi:predicted Rossmann fold flavoprotein
MIKKKLIVIGGGAAGFFCAVNAAQLNTNLRVILLEKSNKLLSKVKVSGGGRCNTTHACFEIPALVKKYPRGAQFLKKSFYQFNTNDTIKWFAERGVELHEESDGRMFPITNNSQTIIDCLLKEADKYGVEIIIQSEVKKIEKKSDQFIVTIADTKELSADFLCIACGGYPKSEMFQWLKATGHSIQDPVPSLFTFNIPNHPITQLMGLSVSNAIVKITGTKLKEQGPLLITHWGLSGPVVLKLSAWGARDLAAMKYEFEILVNWLGDTNEVDLRNEWNGYREQYSAQKIGNKNPFELPNRLWNFILLQSNINIETRWAELKSKEQNKLIQLLTSFSFSVKGKTTFKEEFVTSGGIKLNEINPQTMESKIIPNLFFAGEVMDVDGVTGGFNFQHAWTSGWIAANSIKESVSSFLV